MAKYCITTGAILKVGLIADSKHAQRKAFERVSVLYKYCSDFPLCPNQKAEKLATITPYTPKTGTCEMEWSDRVP